MNRLINIGFGNIVNTAKIVGIISPDAAPVKRMVQNAKDNGTAIDATCGRKTRGVIVTDSGHLVLSALLPETIAGRVNEIYLSEGNTSNGKNGRMEHHE